MDFSVYKPPPFCKNNPVVETRQAGRDAVIRRVLASQKLGVLATWEPRSPYQSLVAFAVSRDLRHIYFATAVSTRKFANLSRSPGVSILFDNRKNTAADFHQAVAVIAQGSADQVPSRSKKGVLGLFLKKHPALDAFVHSPDCRLFRIRVKTYVVVTEFQKVMPHKPAA